jgi:hypothetical protein
MPTFSTGRLVASPSLLMALVVTTSGVASAVPGAGPLVREAIDIAIKKSGHEILERASR